MGSEAVYFPVNFLTFDPPFPRQLRLAVRLQPLFSLGDALRIAIADLNRSQPRQATMGRCDPVLFRS